MTEISDVDIEENLNGIACLIKFIIILDNSGKIIYSKYYTDKNIEQQHEFEKQLCFQAQNLNILPGEIDIFTIDDLNVFVKFIGEVAYFVGINEDDNECLGYNFCKIFENCLSSVLGDNFDRIRFNNRVIATIACKMSVRANTRLSREAMEEIVNELVKCRNPYNCAHGRPSIVKFSTYDLERMFKRVMN